MKSDPEQFTNLAKDPAYKEQKKMLRAILEEKVKEAVK